MTSHRPDEKGLVKWPGFDGEWTDSGEGGLSCAFVVVDDGEFETCFAGNFCRVELLDVIVGGISQQELFPNLRSYRPNPSGEWDMGEWMSEHQSVSLNAWVAIGSTRHSFWSDRQVKYFEPTIHDLEPAGVLLYTALEALYGTGRVRLVTLLDT